MIRKEVDETIFTTINITPLIDILLVLVVMLIISIPIKLNYYNLNFPASGAAAKAEEKKAIELSINSNGDIYWDNTLINDKKDLDEHFIHLKELNSQQEVSLSISKDTLYKKFSMVMSSAQRNNVRNIHIVNKH